MTMTFTSKKAAQAARNQLCATLNVNPATVRVVALNIVAAGRPAVTRWTVQQQ